MKEKNKELKKIEEKNKEEKKNEEKNKEEKNNEKKNNEEKNNEEKITKIKKTKKRNYASSLSKSTSTKLINKEYQNSIRINNSLEARYTTVLNGTFNNENETHHKKSIKSKKHTHKKINLKPKKKLI